MRVMGVDHGEKRIGLAISDLTGTIAGPLSVIKHVSRAVDAALVAALAAEHQAELIVVGQSFDEEGRGERSWAKCGAVCRSAQDTVGASHCALG